jgi:Putative bacterial sensory transduction regulator
MAVEAEWFRAFVERALQQVWGVTQVLQDDDGDYPFSQEGTTAWVSIESEAGLAVCVWSYAAHRVKGTLSVLREVNDLNTGSHLCKVMWRDGGIRVELRLPADQVSAESLGRACGHVKAMSSDIGQVFALVHGGESALAEPHAG